MQKKKKKKNKIVLLNGTAVAIVRKVSKSRYILIELKLLCIELPLSNVSIVTIPASISDAVDVCRLHRIILYSMVFHVSFDAMHNNYIRWWAHRWPTEFVDFQPPFEFQRCCLLTSAFIVCQQFRWQQTLNVFQRSQQQYKKLFKLNLQLCSTFHTLIVHFQIHTHTTTLTTKTKEKKKTKKST